MRNRFGKWSLAVGGVLVGALLLSPVAAHVNNNFAHLWGDHIKPKADNRYVLQKEAAWARVNDEGALVRGEGVDDAGRDSTGIYIVQFKRRVNNCAVTATAWTNGLIASVGPSQGNDTVTVRLINTVNTPVDGDFAVIVRC